jgi:hypothetical protein
MNPVIRPIPKFKKTLLKKLHSNSFDVIMYATTKQIIAPIIKKEKLTKKEHFGILSIIRAIGNDCGR